MSITNYLDNEQNRLSFKELDFLHYMLKNDVDNVNIEDDNERRQHLEEIKYDREVN